jgi:hypothetical protein
VPRPMPRRRSFTCHLYRAARTGPSGYWSARACRHTQPGRRPRRSRPYGISPHEPGAWRGGRPNVRTSVDSE